jgi:uncharacterized protein involved in type VI secretion and phage assembly
MRCNDRDSLFFGKYRGQVANNKDPLKLGRLQVTVPSVLGEDHDSWAMPSVPYAGKGVGFFVLPPVGANIWVEFEGGDPDHPIWSGCFWGEGEIPADPAEEKIRIFKTESFSLLLDESKGLTLEVKGPAVKKTLTMIFDSSGVEIKDENSTIKLTDSKISITSNEVEVKNNSSSIKIASSGIKVTSSKVDINNGALEVM